MKKILILLITVIMLLIAVPAMAVERAVPQPLPPTEVTPEIGSRGFIEWMALPATVIISSYYGFGTGAIATEDGYIITARHVIGNLKEVSVYTNDYIEYAGRVVGYHSIDDCDIAVIKIQPREPLASFSTPDFEGDPGSWNFVANHRQTYIGDIVYAIGHPLGITFTVSKGILTRKHQWGDEGLKYYQYDAATAPGNSGGPLLNELGQLVGIHVQGIPSFFAEGLHFAISVNSFGEEVIMIIEKDRERLGVITNVWEDETEEAEEPKPRQIIITLPDDTKTEEK